MSRLLPLVLLLFFSFYSFSQETNILMDTCSWNSSRIMGVVKINYEKEEVVSSYYDSLDVLRYETVYQIVDSIKCYQCDEFYTKSDYIKLELCIHFQNGSKDTLKSAIPLFDKEYSDEGKLLKVIEYEPLVYEYVYSYCPNAYNPKGGSGPCGSGTQTEFMIRKIEYYNSKEEMFKKEEFENGLLKHVWHYTVDRP